MVNKQLLVISFFGVLSSAVLMKSMLLNFDKDWMKESFKSGKKRLDRVSKLYFSSIYVLEDSKPSLHLDSDKLVDYSDRGVADLLKPRGEAYNDEGEGTHYEGEKGRYIRDKSKLNLTENVVLVGRKSRLEADAANYLIDKDFFRSWGNIKSYSFAPKNGDKVYIDADEAHSWPGKNQAKYIGNVRGRIDRKRPYEPGIIFRSAELFADLNIHKIDLLGNVYMKKQELEAWSLRADIFLENYNKKLKYYVLYDDVKIMEKIPLKDGTIQIRRAFGERLDGFMRQSKMILTGFPKVIQGEDIIKGNVITLFQNKEIVEVDDSNSSFIIKDDDKDEESEEEENKEIGNG